MTKNIFLPLLLVLVPLVAASGPYLNISQPVDSFNVTSPPPQNETSYSNRTSGMDAFGLLLSFALITVPQRSASDEYSTYTMAPTRVSPFICVADVLTTMLWIFYGLHHSLGIRGSAKLAVRKSAVSGAESRRTLLGGQTIIHIVLFIAGPALQVYRLFPIKGRSWVLTWSLIFFVAYVFHIVVDFLGSGTTTDDRLEGPDFRSENQKVQNIFKIVDTMNIAAYSWQITQWIGIFTDLTQKMSSASSEAAVNTILVCLITCAVLISCYGRTIRGERIIHGLWSFKNWTRRHWYKIGLIAFANFLILGPLLPTSIGEKSSLLTPSTSAPLQNIWPLIAPTLGTLAIVVIEVFVVAGLHTTFSVLDHYLWPIVAPLTPEDPWGCEDVLKERWNPLVASPPKWREVLSITFACCNITFGLLYYRFLSNS